MGVYYLVHNIAFIAWVLHHNSSQVVAFPNKKSYIFDNKLDFSGIKLAESYGFRYSNFKVNSQVIRFCLGCFKFKPFGYFRLQWYWLTHVAWSSYHAYGPHDGTGSPSWHRIATGPWCLLKVRLCSPLQLGLTSLVGASLDYPQLLRLALPNPFMHESLR